MKMERSEFLSKQVDNAFEQVDYFFRMTAEMQIFWDIYRNLQIEKLKYEVENAYKKGFEEGLTSSSSLQRRDVSNNVQF